VQRSFVGSRSLRVRLRCLRMTIIGDCPRLILQASHPFRRVRGKSGAPDDLLARNQGTSRLAPGFVHFEVSSFQLAEARDCRARMQRSWASRICFAVWDALRFLAGGRSDLAVIGLPRAYALGYFIPPLRGLVFVLSFAVVRADLKAGSSAAEGSVPPCRVLSRLPRLENRETWGTRLLLIET
jgi:hypothetical protein